jgi:hypothetical protein
VKKRVQWHCDGHTTCRWNGHGNLNLNLSKLEVLVHAGTVTSYGIKIGSYYDKMWSKHGKEEQLLCSWTIWAGLKGLNFLGSEARAGDGHGTDPRHDSASPSQPGLSPSGQVRGPT